MRKKDNITLIGDALQKLLGIHGYMYTLIADRSLHYGVIAQEVEKIFPSLVVTDAQGLKAVRYNSLIGVLIESIHDIDSILLHNKNILEENERLLQTLESK
jgi:Chaperone of endosialidase